MKIIIKAEYDQIEIRDRKGIPYRVTYENGELLGTWIDNVIKYAAQKLIFNGANPDEDLYIFNIKNQLIFREKPIRIFAEEGRKEYEFGESYQIRRKNKRNIT